MQVDHARRGRFLCGIGRFEELAPRHQAVLVLKGDIGNLDLEAVRHGRVGSHLGREHDQDTDDQRPDGRLADFLIKDKR